MTPAQAAEILAAHNKWRRHNSSDDLPPMPMVDPLDLGKAIDVAVKALADQVAQAEPYGWVLPQGTDDSLFRDHRTVQACTWNKWEGWQPVYLAAPVALAAQGVPTDLCERICAAIKAADDKSTDEAEYMLDSDDCIAIVREHFAAAPAPEATGVPMLQCQLAESLAYWVPGVLPRTENNSRYRLEYHLAHGFLAQHEKEVAKVGKVSETTGEQSATPAQAQQAAEGAPTMLQGDDPRIEPVRSVVERLCGTRQSAENFARRILAAADSVALPAPDQAQQAAPEGWETANAVGDLMLRLDQWRATNPRTAPPAWAALIEACRAMVAAADAEKSLQAQAQQAEAKPLTSEQTKALMRQAGYGKAHAQAKADFINGLRHGERAHGIGASSGENGK